MHIATDFHALIMYRFSTATATHIEANDRFINSVEVTEKMHRTLNTNSEVNRNFLSFYHIVGTESTISVEYYYKFYFSFYHWFISN